MKKNVLALSISIAVLATSAATTAQADPIAELQAELAALQQQVSLLKQAAAASVDTSAQASVPAAAPVAESEAVQYATSSDIDGIRAELENFKYDEARQQERGTVKASRDSSLYGVVQVRVQAQDEPTAAGNPAPNSVRRDSFDIPTALIGVRGNLFRDYKEGKNLDYQVSFAYAKRATAGAASDLNLADAFVRYNVLSTAGGLEGDRLNVTLGQQLIPFGLEAQAPEDLRPTIDVATTPAQLGLFNRQVGLIVRGDFKSYVDYSANYRAPLLEYAFGVLNGNGANKLDDNGSKDYIARAAFTLPVDYASVFRELKFGASYLKGTKNVTNAAGVTVLDGDGKRDRLGFDIYYNHAPYGATYEYIQGRTDWADAANQIREVKSEGHTLTLFYNPVLNAPTATLPTANDWRVRPRLVGVNDGLRPTLVGHSDEQQSITVEAAGLVGSFYAQAELARTTHDRVSATGASLPSEDVDAFYVQGSYILTGESKRYNAKKGLFLSPNVKDSGVIELKARFEQTKNRDTNAEATQYIVGANYYFNPNTRALLEYVDGSFQPAGSAPEQNASAVQARLQFNF